MKLSRTLTTAQESLKNMIVKTPAPGSSAKENIMGFVGVTLEAYDEIHAGELKEKDDIIGHQQAEMDETKKAFDDLKMKLETAEKEKTAAEKAQTTAMAGMKKENEALVAAKHEDNKLKKKCKHLEEKLEGQLEAFAEEKKIARDNMKKRHDEELERCAEGAKLRIKHAVASAVEEKDEEIEELTRVNKLLRDYRRKSEGSTISNSPST